MSTKHTLNADSRTVVGRQVKHLRRGGFVPANIFSKHAPSINIQVNAKDFQKVFDEVGESTLVYLQVGGEKDGRPVLVREVTVHPVTGMTLHIDFNEVSLKEKVTAPVAIELVGEAPAETEKLGILVQQLDEVEVEALPTDMPEHLEVSIEGLLAVDDAVYVKDIKVDPTKVEIKSDLEAIVAKIEGMAKEEPAEEAPAAEGEEATTATEGEPTEGAASATEEKTEE